MYVPGHFLICYIANVNLESKLNYLIFIPHIYLMFIYHIYLYVYIYVWILIFVIPCVYWKVWVEFKAILFIGDFFFIF